MLRTPSMSASVRIHIVTGGTFSDVLRPSPQSGQLELKEFSET